MKKGKPSNLSHIASGLFPSASLIAVPSTPVPVPDSKNQPHLKTSPLYGALVGASNLSRSIGGSDPSHGLAESLRSSGLGDTGMTLPQEENEYDEAIDSDPGYTTVGSDEGRFFQRQRRLTPPPPRRATSRTPSASPPPPPQESPPPSPSTPPPPPAVPRPQKRSSRRKEASPRQTQPIYSKPTRIGRGVDDDRIGRGVEDDRIGRGVEDDRIGRGVEDDRGVDRNYSDENDRPVGISMPRRDPVHEASIQPISSSLTGEGALAVEALQNDSENKELGHLRRQLKTLNAKKMEQKRKIERLTQQMEEMQFQFDEKQRSRSPEEFVRAASQDFLDSLQLKIEGLEASNETLRQEVTRLTKILRLKEESKAKATTEMIYEDQNKEMRKEIHSLQSTIQRLSVELSQAQVYHDSLGENEAGETIPKTPLKAEGPVPSWLVNTKYLSPLLAAYDEKLREKDKVLIFCRQELTSLRSKFDGLDEDNERLRDRVERVQEAERSRVDEECSVLEGHNQLLIRENQLLMTQMNLKEEKLTSSEAAALAEKARLEADSAELENRLRGADATIEALRRDLRDLKEKHDAVLAEDEGKMAIEEHVQELQDLKRLVGEMKAKHATEMSNLEEQLKICELDKTSLRKNLNELASSLTEKEKLTDEYKEQNRKMSKKFRTLTKKFLFTKKLQEDTAFHLEQVCEALEKSRLERNAVAQLFNRDADERREMLSQFLRKSAVVGRKEEKLRNYKVRVGDKLLVNATKVKKLDLTHAQHRLEYQRRIQDLQKLLDEREAELLRRMDEEVGLDEREANIRRDKETDYA